MEGINKQEIHVALNDSDAFVGFLWVIKNGAFHSFPYLHIIAIKSAYRHCGFGNTMMQYFENVLCDGRSKAFLVVADFNPSAKRFYENLRYRVVGKIDGLYKRGVTEYIMMKALD